MLLVNYCVFKDIVGFYQLATAPLFPTGGCYKLTAAHFRMLHANLCTSMASGGCYTLTSAPLIAGGGCYKLTSVTSMACPSSRSKVTTHTHSNQDRNWAHVERESVLSTAFPVSLWWDAGPWDGSITNQRSGSSSHRVHNMCVFVCVRCFQLIPTTPSGAPCRYVPELCQQTVLA